MWHTLTTSDLKLQCPLWKTLNFNMVLNHGSTYLKLRKNPEVLNKRRNKNKLLPKSCFSVIQNNFQDVEENQFINCWKNLQLHLCQLICEVNKSTSVIVLEFKALWYKEKKNQCCLLQLQGCNIETQLWIK